MRYRNTFCIAGTDTDVGKTVVTSALLRSFASKGFATRGIKPVQTGCLNLVSMTVSPDVEVYREACPDCQALALECLVPACSPHLAARMDKRLLSVEGLVEKLDAAIADQAGVTLIEGAGGLYVPLNEHQYIITLFQALRAPVVLVAAYRPGSLNHLPFSQDPLRTNGTPLS